MTTAIAILIAMLVAYLIPNYGPRVLGDTPVAGALFFGYWIVALVPGVFASAVCVEFMRHQSVLWKFALLILGAVLTVVFTATTLSFAALSDGGAEQGFFRRILSAWWVYMFGLGITGFIALLEYGGDFLRIVRRRQNTA